MEICDFLHAFLNLLSIWIRLRDILLNLKSYHISQVSDLLHVFLFLIDQLFLSFHQFECLTCQHCCQSINLRHELFFVNIWTLGGYNNYFFWIHCYHLCLSLWWNSFDSKFSARSNILLIRLTIKPHFWCFGINSWHSFFSLFVSLSCWTSSTSI